MSTAIEWTDATWNPVTGCTKVSEGCDHCYIERTPPFRMAGRKFDLPGVGGTTGVKLYSDRLHLPLSWRKPRRVFVNSLSDLFHEHIPDEFIAEVFAVMALTPRHTYQVLTKRPGRLRSLLNKPTFPRLVENRLYKRHAYANRLVYPLPNVWLGVSTENQHWATIRIPALMDTPAAVRWISAEPLLGPVEVHPRLDWVVVGGESGPGARPMHPAWARSLRDQCVSADVPFFFKQWGEWASVDQMPDDTAREVDAVMNLSQPHPDPMRVGKKRAGRELDGHTWDEYPAVVS